LKTKNQHVQTRAGFTLIELLTVMGIIGIICSIAVISYINIRSGGAYMSLAKNLQNHVMLARQQAALENREVRLVFAQDPDGSHDVLLVFHGGYVTAKGSGSPPADSGLNTGDYIADAFTSPPTMLSAKDIKTVDMKLYNLGAPNVPNAPNAGKSYSVKAWPENESVPPETTLYNNDKLFHPTRRGYSKKTIRYYHAGIHNQFNVGDAYGFVLHQSYRLPKNLKFASVTPGNLEIVIFKPNGEITDKAGNPINTKTFKVNETIRKNSVDVTINSKGVVKVDY